MSEPIPTTNAQTIAAWVGTRSLELGRDYFENGAVFDLRRQGSCLKARCQGSMPQPYRLQVAFGADGIEAADCSCPVGGGGHCKHVGALLLAWLDQPDAFRTVPELDADLERRSKEDLIALVKQMLRRQPDLEALLEVGLPGGDRRHGSVDPDTYRRLVSSAFRRAGDGWLEYRQIAGDIESIASAGDDFLALSDYVGANVVYRAVLQGIQEYYEMAFDEDGEMFDVVEQCVEGLANCLAAGGEDSVVREQTLRTLFDIYRFDMDSGGIGLAEGAPDLILEHATDEEKRAVAGWVRAAMAGGSGWSDKYRRQAHGRFLLDLEKSHLDDDGFLGICRECGLATELVDRLLTLGRLNEAISETELAGDYDLLILADVFRRRGYGPSVEPLLVRRIETSRDDRLMEWLMVRHRDRGELAEALALAKRLLRARPYLARYQEVRDLSRQLGVWQELRPDLLAEWSAAGQFGLLTDVHLEEGEIDEALCSVRRQQTSRFPYEANRMLQVAEAATRTHPRAAIQLYLEQAESLIEARGRANYHLACDHLTTARDIYRQLDDEPEWTHFVAQLRERHRRLRALQEELDSSGL